jgi:hypothetical protein
MPMKMSESEYQEFLKKQANFRSAGAGHNSQHIVMDGKPVSPRRGKIPAAQQAARDLRVLSAQMFKMDLPELLSGFGILVLTTSEATFFMY